ncbi:hypothetical protein M3Y99_01591500 [Aphelenchoides fujianensis]|nr:hypothetical protein M3Y99_01591500 [Aphelenchoides fujianensis]
MALNSFQLTPFSQRHLFAALLGGHPVERPKMFAEDRRRVSSPPLALLRSLLGINSRYRATVLRFFRSCRLEIRWPRAERANNEGVYWGERPSKSIESENTPLSNAADEGRIAFHQRNGDVLWFPLSAFSALRRLEIVGQHVDELGVHPSLSDGQAAAIIRLFSSVHRLNVPPKAEAAGIRLVHNFASSLRDLECSSTMTQRADFPDLQLKRFHTIGPSFTLLSSRTEHSLKRILQMPVEHVDLSGSQCGGLEDVDGECPFHPAVRKLTAALYGPRASSWLGRVLPGYFAFLDTNAHELKDGKGNTDYFCSFKDSSQYAVLFHENLRSSAGRPYGLRLTRISLRSFENLRLTCVRLLFSATLQGARLELGVRGEEHPQIREHFAFDEIPTAAARFEAACEKFADYVNRRFGLQKHSGRN